MTAALIAINQEGAQSTETFVDAVDAFLQSVSPLSVQSLYLTRRKDSGSPRFNLSIAYTTPGAANLRARYFAGTGDVDALDQDVADFFADASNLDKRIIFVRDMSQELRRYTVHNALMVVYSDSILPNAGQDRGRPMVVVTGGASIAPGATGTVQVVSSAGVQAATMQVRNRSGVTWDANAYGYAQFVAGQTVADGYYTCCPP